MGATFSAGPQALGYLYQARVALAMLLETSDDAFIKLEALDDIQIEDKSNSAKLTLAQLKHHVKKESDLTDYSTDLWKSIRVWAEQVTAKSFALTDTKIILLTTSTSKTGSIASLLGAANRDTVKALELLETVADDSKSVSLSKSFFAYKALSDPQKKALVSSITVLDSQNNIDEYKDIIKKKIRPTVRKIHLNSLYERLEGWWFDKVVTHLLFPEIIQSISAYELNEKIASLAQSFAEDDLPIDFLDAIPESSYFIDSEKKLFVKQLKEINQKQRVIEKAILDYYRAFNQRSKWINDGLVLPDELTKFEARLIDEWERFFDSVYDDTVGSKSEEDLVSIGSQVLAWAEFKALHLKIRPRVDSDFVRRGSFHLLADKEPEPAIHWHPQFIKKLKLTISIAANNG